MKKRILSLLLALCLALSLLPAAALAEESGSAEPAGEELLSAETADEADEEVSVDDPQPVDEEPYADEETIEEEEPYTDDETTTPSLDGSTDTHDHCICGADLPCTSHYGLSFKPWSDSTSLPSKSSPYYYLTCDVTLSTQWTPPDGVILCLNGHSITADFNGAVIKIGAGVTFTLNDCQGTGKITHASGRIGGGVFVNSAGAFTMYGGNITGNDCSTSVDIYDGAFGGGIDLEGDFTMYGGSIANNTALIGGGIYAHEYSYISLCGGSITGNKAITNSGVPTSGAGGGIYTYGTLEIAGGSITNNTAATHGGGIFADATYKTSTIDISSTANSVTITGNHADNCGGGIHSARKLNFSGDVTMTGNSAGNYGGGIYTKKSDSGAIRLSGNVNITGNTTGSGSAATANNIHLVNTSATINVNGFTGKAGVTKLGDNNTIANFTQGSACAGTLTSDDDNYIAKTSITYGEVYLYKKSAKLEITYSGSNKIMAPEGYTDAPSVTYTVTNTGSKATGALTITCSETNFVPSVTELDPLEPGESATFTVKPKPDLAASGSLPYGAFVVVTDETDSSIAESATISFTVASYSIALTKTKKYTFPDAIVGYDAQDALTVTVRNSGNQPTGSLSVALSGSGSDKFELSKTEIDSIEERNETATFTVTPKDGLAPGTYEATVTVSGENVSSVSRTVTFTVKPKPVYTIALSQTDAHTFPDANEGYGAQDALTVTVSNTGNQPTGDLSVSVSGSDFTLSTSTISSIAVDGSATSFTVAPREGLDVGTYEATVTVTGGNDIRASFNVSFTVNSSTPTSIDGASVRIGKAVGGDVVVTVELDGKVLVAEKDYTFTSRTDASTGLISVTVTGNNARNYFGEVTKTLDHVPGEMDSTDGVTILDVLTLLKAVAEIAAMPAHADINADGHVTIMDVLALLKYVAGITGSVIY